MLLLFYNISHWIDGHNLLGNCLNVRLYICFQFSLLQIMTWCLSSYMLLYLHFNLFPLICYKCNYLVKTVSGYNFGYKHCWIDLFFFNNNYNIFKDKRALWDLFDKGTNPVLEDSVFICKYIPKASPRVLSSKITPLSNERKYKHFQTNWNRNSYCL